MCSAILAVRRMLEPFRCSRSLQKWCENASSGDDLVWVHALLEAEGCQLRTGFFCKAILGLLVWQLDMIFQVSEVIPNKTELRIFKKDKLQDFWSMLEIFRPHRLGPKKVSPGPIFIISQGLPKSSLLHKNDFCCLSSECFLWGSLVKVV